MDFDLIYEVNNFSDFYNKVILMGNNLLGVLGAAAPVIFGSISSVVVLVAVAAMGVSIYNFETNALKNDGKLQQSFMTTMDNLFSNFDTQLRNYVGDNKTYLKAKEIQTRLDKSGKSFISYFASFFWMSVKSTLLLTNPLGVLDLENWKAVLPTNPDFWAIMKAFAYYMTKSGSFEIEITTETKYQDALSLLQAITNSTQIEFELGDYEQNFLNFIQELIDSNSTYYIIEIISEKGRMWNFDCGQYMNNDTVDYKTFYIFYPTNLSEVSMKSTDWAYYSSLDDVYKPSQNIKNWTYEVLPVNTSSTLQPGLMYYWGYAIFPSVDASMIGFNYIKNQGIKNFSKVTGYSGNFAGIGVNEANITKCLGIYGSHNEGQRIEAVNELLVGSGANTITVSPTVINPKLTDEAYSNDVVNVVSPTGVIDEDGTLTGDITISIDNSIWEELDKVNSGLIDISNVLEGIGASIAVDNEMIEGIIADSISATLEQARENENKANVIPVTSTASAGLYRMYNPTNSQIKQLGKYLWSKDIFDQLKQIWADPLDAIISLSIFPVQPDSNKSANCVLGYNDTNISMKVVSSQFKQINAGSIMVYPKYNNFLDYDPFTKITIFVPYVGFQDLNVNEVMNSRLTLYYNIDFLSGAFNATLYCDKNNINEVLYQWSGTMNMQIPLSSGNYSQLLQSVATIATGAAVGGVAGAAGAAAGELLTGKTDVRTKGGITGCAGALGAKVPYLIISRPIRNIPDNYEVTEGYVSKKGGKISDFEGWTIFDNVELNVNATKEELEEISQLLKEGVYV